MRPAVFLLAVSLCAASASAQGREDRALIEQGRALRRAGRNEDALRSFRAAYALRPTPEAAGQIGFAEHALERWEPAWRHLHEALAEPGDPWVIAQREALDFSLHAVEAHLGSLRVDCAAPGATVAIAERADTALPMRDALRLAPGEVEIETRAPGHASARQRVTIAEGETVRLVVQLARLRVEAPPTRAAVAPEAPVRGGSAPVAVAPTGSTQRTLGWIAAGGAVVFGGGGLAAMLVRDSSAAFWNDDARCLVGGRTREQNCSPSRERVELMQTLMIAGFTAGAVLAVSAAIALPLSMSRRHEPALTVGLHPGGLSLGGRF